MTRMVVLSLFLVILPAAASWGQNTSAANSSRSNPSILPQGRFLKRVRDELASDNRKQENVPSPTVDQQSDDGLWNQTPPRGMAPPPHFDTPTARMAHPDPRLLSTPPQQPRAAGATRQDDSRATRPARDSRSGPKAVGFGWKLEERNDQLVVTHVDRGGNAERVGIKPGDLVIELGGIPINRQDEYREIAGIFGEGDQIVVKLMRGGKTFERDLQFGEAPDADDAASYPGGLGNPAANGGSGSARFETPNYNPGGIADFAPPIVTPAANPRNRAGQGNLPSASNHPSSPVNPARSANSRNSLSPQDQEILRLQQIVRQQNEIIRQLQTEIENLKKRSNSNHQRGLFGR